MTRTRGPLLLALLTLLAAGPAAAGEREPLGLQGAPVQVVPPEGTWRVHTATDAPGQWSVTLRRGPTVLQALVFPRRPGSGADLRQTLFQAAGLVLAPLGVEGVGLPEATAIDLLGHEGVEGTLSLARDGVRTMGRARLLAASVTHWALAWGITPDTGADAAPDVVRAFVASLAPLAPFFFTPRFATPTHDERIVVQPPDEEPIRWRHILATERLIETGHGGPFSLARREQLRRLLVADAKRGTKKFRDALRTSPQAFAPQPGLTEAQQKDKQHSVGRKILHTYFLRRATGDALGDAFLQVWKAGRVTVVGTDEDGLTERHVDNLLEMLAFLASVASDRPQRVGLSERGRLTAFLEARWPELSDGVRQALRAAPTTWLRLRWRFDTADAASRLAFRRRLAEHVAPPTLRPALAGIDTPEDLKRWFDAREQLDVMAFLERNALLEPLERGTLLAPLGATTEGAVPLGW